MQSLFNGAAWREHMQRQAAAEQADAEVHAPIKRARRTRAHKAEQTDEDATAFIEAINAAGAANATANETPVIVGDSAAATCWVDLESHLEMLIVPQPDGTQPGPYTHLTLPTKRTVSMSAVVGAVHKKTN